MKSSTIIIIAILLIFAVVGIFALMPSGGARDVPWYAKSHQPTWDAYKFAIEDPESLNGVNCYCGCMQHQHDGRLHSRGLLDCFTKPDGSFDRHASQCDMCINDALEVKQMTMEGKTKDEIRNAIDGKYAGMTG